MSMPKTSHSLPVGQENIQRACDGCTLCCKLFHVPVLHKIAGEWCTHCDVSSGCQIHNTRPDHCREFHCWWIEEHSIPDYWKPEASKIILTIFPDNGFLYAQVDPGRPDAWKNKRLLNDLKNWSKTYLKSRRHVLVFVNDIATLIMPDQSVPLGKMQPGEGFGIKPYYVEGEKFYEVIRAAQ